MTAPHPSLAGLRLDDPTTYRTVQRIYWKRFSRRIQGAGMDPEDGFQEVCMRLHRRQAGKSRFDPARSSLSNYLFLNMTGICINLAEKCRTVARVGASDLHHNRDDAGPRKGTGVEDGRYVCGDELTWGPEAVEGAVVTIGVLQVEELAWELDAPDQVVMALLAGRDPFVAAMDGGFSFKQADALVRSLGLR